MMLERAKKIFLLINRAIKSPILVSNYVKWKVSGYLSTSEFVGSQENRSDSENGMYIASVLNAVKSYKKFSVFKINPLYREILEHVTKNQGDRYLEILQNQSPWMLSSINDYKENDIIGSPKCYEYINIGLISPTTLRYMKVSSDLIKFFGREKLENIVEIGVGYGGQALVNDKTFKIKTYELIDLPPVLELTSRYLEGHILNCAYKLGTLNQKTGDEQYDLVISNYAFSELPMSLQLKYIEKIIKNCKRGYMTMNSGLVGSVRTKNKLSLAKLKELLPKFEVIEEDPLTFEGNYIIIWGHK